MNNTNRKFTHIKRDLFLIYMYMSLCVYVHMHVCAHGGQKRAPDSLELELLTAVCHSPGAGNWTQYSKQHVLLHAEPPP